MQRSRTFRRRKLDSQHRKQIERHSTRTKQRTLDACCCHAFARRRPKPSIIKMNQHERKHSKHITSGIVDSRPQMVDANAEGSGISTKRRRRTNISQKNKHASGEAGYVFLRERINANSLKEIASKEAAGFWKPSRQGPFLRAIIADILAQEQNGFIRSSWREEDRMIALNKSGRRYSGYEFDSDVSD